MRGIVVILYMAYLTTMASPLLGAREKNGDVLKVPNISAMLKS